MISELVNPQSLCGCPELKVWLKDYGINSVLDISNKSPNLVRGLTYEPRHEKTNILVSDLVRHKPGCTATEDG